MNCECVQRVQQLATGVKTAASMCCMEVIGRLRNPAAAESVKTINSLNRQPTLLPNTYT